MNGLSTLNIELTSRCNANCWCCGRRKLEREYPELCSWGDIEFEFLKEISKQVPAGVVCQFHWNGEPTLYPRLGEALDLFSHCIRQFNTNGKLIFERADEIIGRMEALTISVVEREEGEEQYETVRRFISIRGTKSPYLIYRLLGNVDKAERWRRLPGTVAKRVLHSPNGSFDYERKPTIPEIGICLDLLTHMAIDRYGNISMCVRFDPKGYLRLGNIKDMALTKAWDSLYRKRVIQAHIGGHRDMILGCKDCHFWGVPTSQ